MVALTLENISKKHNQQTILDSINLTIDAGEFITIVGPSGCGKSTLLRLVAGLDELSSGRILINNKCVNSVLPHLRDMAMVFQSYALYPHMTVYNNIAYGLKMRKIATAEIEKQVQDVAKMLQLSDYLQRKPQQLSGGQRQRVAMGRAIVRRPAVFLFDEPLSNLDTKLRTEMRFEMRKLHQQLKTTSLYVTHDQTEAMTLASRVVVLNQGKIEQVAAPKQLYLHPASVFVANFTGSHPINLFAGEVDLANQKIILVEKIVLPLPKFTSQVNHGEKIYMGIRPEHLFLSENSSNQITVKLNYVEDTGVDKLIHVNSLDDSKRFIMRTSSDAALAANLTMNFSTDKAVFFSQKTSLRIGTSSD